MDFLDNFADDFVLKIMIGERLAELLKEMGIVCSASGIFSSIGLQETPGGG